jgi:hypothetical protein
MIPPRHVDFRGTGCRTVTKIRKLGVKGDEKGPQITCKMRCIGIYNMIVNLYLFQHFYTSLQPG